MRITKIVAYEVVKRFKRYNGQIEDYLSIIRYKIFLLASLNTEHISLQTLKSKISKISLNIYRECIVPIYQRFLNSNNFEYVDISGNMLQLYYVFESFQSSMYSAPKQLNKNKKKLGGCFYERICQTNCNRHIVGDIYGRVNNPG